MKNKTKQKMAAKDKQAKKAKIADFANSLKGVITMDTTTDIWDLEIPQKKESNIEYITIQIDTKTKEGKLFKEMLKTVYSKLPGIEIVLEKSPYNPEFVKMVKKSSASKKRYVIDTNNIWGSLELEK